METLNISAQKVARALHVETAARLNLGSHRASVRLLFGFSGPSVFPLSVFLFPLRVRIAVSRRVISGVRASPRLLCVRAPVLRAKASCRGVAAAPDVPDFIYFTPDTADTRAAIKEEEEK